MTAAFPRYMRPPLGTVHDDPNRACLDADTEAFFHTTGPQAEVAKRVCEGCPAREACLRWALEVDDQHSILGGYTPAERRRLRRGVAA